jgi:hypothetical protein
MGIFSRFRSRKPQDQTDDPVHPDQPHSLVRSRYVTPKQEEIDRVVEADIARIEGDTDVDREAPGDQRDEL